MTVSVVTADTVLALAKSIKSLSEDQMRRISDLVVFMSDEDLRKLEGMLKGVQEAEMEGMKREIETYKGAAAAYKEFKADKVRGKREKIEKQNKIAEDADATSLLNNL